jgi:HK97 family phage portal protein
MIASAIRKVFSTSRGPLNDFWYRPAGVSSTAGIDVTDSLALSVSTFWACVRVLSDTLGAMPWHLYQSIGDDDRRKASDHPLYGTIHERPNGWQSPIEWKSMGVGHLLLRGNFYCRIDYDNPYTKYPAFVPMNPDRVKVEQSSAGAVTYEHKHQDGTERTYGQDRIVHVKLMSLDGVRGLAPLEYARATLGLGLAQTKHASTARQRCSMRRATPSCSG